jgi:CheY-like chemotaxis protein/tetratricopeptide (TPR) repeat protein
MNLAEARLKPLENDALTLEALVLSRCQEAAKLIYNGQYEAAKDELGDLWSGIGERPSLRGLSDLMSAEVLLRCGALSGFLGSSTQTEDAQEEAKDLIFESLRLFQAHSLLEKVAEAQYELGECYRREGAYDESRIMLREALSGADSTELKAKILIRSSIVEIWSGCYHEALDVLEEAASFLESCDDALKGRWHGQKALALRRLGSIEKRKDYLDRAIIEYTAAIYHHEQSSHERYCGNTLNNLAFLFYKLGRYDEAHDNLNRAVNIFKRLNDTGGIAQVEETKARVLLAEKRFNEANYVIADVIRKLENGGESALFTDALVVQGTILSKLKSFERSIETLRRAVEVATYAGALHNAGLAALTLIEEHGAAERLNDEEMYDLYCQADDFLKNTQDAEEITRLRLCARLVTERLNRSRLKQSNVSIEDGSFTKALHSFEARLIEEALRLESGSVSRAAKRLGIKHQSLAHLLNTRHTHLLVQRTPIVKRKRSIITTVRERRRVSHCDIKTETKSITVLHIDDDENIARLVRNMLTAQGWRVETCLEGSVALEKLEGNDKYDILIVDNDMPGIKGIEIIRRARQLAHRQMMPIVMFSGNFTEQDAFDAGADMALRKPEDTSSLIAKISSLVKPK